VMNPEREVTIAMVGKYMELLDAYKSLIEALRHAGIQTRTRVRTRYIDSSTLETEGTAALEGVDAIVVPGGFGERGVEGMIIAANFARTHRIPYLGICLGLHIAVIEFARNVLGLTKAHSTEFDQASPDPVIALITEWVGAGGTMEVRSEDSDLGGTMRLGAQECRVEDGSLIKASYGTDIITERHRHRYELNNNYVERLHAAGMRVTGKSLDGNLMEVVEITDHPWYLACQFHPEFTSTPRDGHPLFTSFVKAAIAQSQLSQPADSGAALDAPQATATAHPAT
ncbi:MAG TPA: CTP synthase, partial [Pseudomonadaceae bacterium]|nr:CTP synthase [Pseudomonadaceae bacterium]